MMFQAFYQCRHGAALEPVVSGGPVVQCSQQTERCIYILTFGREMLAVILLSQQGISFFNRELHLPRILLYTWTERSVQFLLRDSADTRIIIQHGNLI